MSDCTSGGTKIANVPNPERSHLLGAKSTRRSTQVERDGGIIPIPARQLTSSADRKVFFLSREKMQKSLLSSTS